MHYFLDYDSDNHDALERYYGIISEASRLGFERDHWFLNQLERLNLAYRRGNKALEQRIIRGLKEKFLLKQVQSNLCLFQEIPQEHLVNEGVKIGELCRVMSSGEVIELGIPYLYPLELFKNHVLISGAQGAGKTRLILGILQAIAQYNQKP